MAIQSSMVFTEREVSNEAIKILGSMNLEKDDYEKVKFQIRDSSGYLHRMARERTQEKSYIAECNFAIRNGDYHISTACKCLKQAALTLIKKKMKTLNEIIEAE